MIHTNPRRAVEYDEETHLAMVQQKRSDRPYDKLLQILADEELILEEHQYWKTDREDLIATSTHVKVKQDQGWDLHVILYKGHSSIEYYRRHGKGLDAFELKLILAANSQGGWQEVSKQSLPMERIFDFNYENKDAQLRAMKVAGHGLLIYHSTLEERAYELLQKQLNEKQQEQKVTAPQAVVGF